jgi:hypothetical protein
MLRLTTGSMFRLVAITAVALAVANWWPRALPPARDGSVTWYHGIWGSRSFYKITGADRFGCTFSVKLNSLPSYSPMTGAYSYGSPRERSVVFVTGSVDGCEIRRSDVQTGEYFAPDGTTIGRVVNGTGNVKYCRPDGTPALEYELINGQIIRERKWWKDGYMLSDQQYQDGHLHGLSIFYYPNGNMQSETTFQQNAAVNVVWYDQNGNPAAKPDVVNLRGNY